MRPTPSLSLLVLLAACAPAAVGGGAAAPAASPYADAAAYSRAHNGDAVLVVRGDSVVFEEYQNGYGGSTPHPLQSGTKAFACALMAAAVGDGLLELDEPISRALPEVRNNPLAARVTVRHLLTLTSGLARTNAAPDGSVPRDRYHNASLLPMQAPPGERFAYGDAQMDLFGEVMRRKLAPRGEDPLAYLERRVFVPIGLRVGFWQRDEAGNPLLASGAALTAREWAKLGRLVRDGGRWEGRQVLPEAPLRECFRGTDAQPRYGIGFWVNAALPDRRRALYDGRGGLPDLVMAIGAGNQYLWVIPSEGLVVVRLGQTDESWRAREFLARVLGDPVPPLPPNPSGPIRP